MGGKVGEFVASRKLNSSHAGGTEMGKVASHSEKDVGSKFDGMRLSRMKK